MLQKTFTKSYTLHLFIYEECGLKNRLTIGKFRTIDTSNNSRELDAKKTAFPLFMMNFPMRRTWTWGIKVK